MRAQTEKDYIDGVMRERALAKSEREAKEEGEEGMEDEDDFSPMTPEEILREKNQRDKEMIEAEI